MNMQRYERFCLADPVFFDAPQWIPDDGDRFEFTRRPVPDGWDRGESGWWIALRPQGVALPTQGWKIHVSATLADAAKVSGLVWDYCVEQGTAFKILRGRSVVLHANSKHADRSSSGKLATIYPVDDEHLTRTLAELSEVLDGFAGPHILTDLRYGRGPLYVRYGAFAAQTCPGADGEPTFALRRPDGRLVPDNRAPVFAVPEWVTIPQVLRPHVDLLLSEPPNGFPYRVESALHFSNGGGVYLARREQTNESVVLREARPHAGLDRDGTDAVGRLAREHAMLERVAGLDCVPRVLDHRVVWEHHFLVEEYVEGSTLMEAVRTRYPLVHPDPSEAEIDEYTAWATDVLSKVENALDQLHGRGVRFGDLHPGNVIQRPDGSVVLVDFELATELTDERTPPLGAPGFTAPAGLSGVEADRYLLNCLRLWTFLPLSPLPDREPAKLVTLTDTVMRRFPLPQGFGAQIVRNLWRGGASPGPDAAGLLFETEQPHWPTIRDSLVAGIHASATPHREDRLFPGDPAQFEDGGFALAYGAAGVFHALHHAGVPVPDEYVTWLVRAAHRARHPRAGLYDGLHGVAATLDTLGHRQHAMEVLERARGLEPPVATAHLMGGRAGIGLNLLHFAQTTGDEGLRTDAVRAGDELADLLHGDSHLHTPTKGGLLRGMTGPALLFLRLYEDTDDSRYLDLARAALQRDLARGVILADGTFPLLEGSRYLVYPDGGSSGVALVAHEYLRHRDDPELAAMVAAVRRSCRVQWIRQPGLFLGRAGIIATLAQLGVAEDAPVIRDHVRRLAWHAQTHRGHLAFPGAQMLRLSMDLATGSAGVLLALSAALGESAPVLPYLDRRVETTSHGGR